MSFKSIPRRKWPGGERRRASRSLNTVMLPASAHIMRIMDNIIICMTLASHDVWWCSGSKVDLLQDENLEKLLEMLERLLMADLEVEVKNFSSGTSSSASPTSLLGWRRI